MKHWHDCQRWSSRGFSCPFRLLEMEEEQQEEPETPDQLRAKEIRHAALAQERETVPVSAGRTILNWHGFAEAENSLVNAGLIQAVSTEVVPPFERPVGIPTYIGQQEGRGIEQPTAANVPATTNVGAAAAPTGVPATPAPGVTDPFGANTKTGGLLRDPRVVEEGLASALADAVATAAAEPRPAQAGVGAPASRQTATTEEQLLTAQAGAAASSQERASQIALADVYRLEAFLAAATAYGTIESFKAWRNRNQPFRERGRIIRPRPILHGRPSSGTGDIPGQGNMLREFRVGLRQGEQP